MSDRQPPESVVSSSEDAAAILARIKPTRRQEWHQVCLRPDLIDEWIVEADKLGGMVAEREEREQQTQRLNPRTKTEQSSMAERKQAETVKELEERIESPEATMWLLFEALPNDEWQILTEQYPPRKDDMQDQFAGYDRKAAIDAAVRQCIVKPAFTDESWAELLPYINPSEWEAMRDTTNRVNGRYEEAPKSRLAASVLTRRVGGSRRRGGGASAPESSTEPQPEKSTSTTTSKAS